jgi:hypothetical protein
VIAAVVLWLWLWLGAVSGRPEAAKAEVVAWEPTGIHEVDRAVLRWKPATMVPFHFKDQQGNVRIDDLTLACLVLYDLGVRPGPNLPEVFVIKGRVGFSGKLLAALAARQGWDLEPVEETPERCTWRIRQLDMCDPMACVHWKPSKSITMADAERAGWSRRSPRSPDTPSTYELMPDRMLSWRCITWLIDHYAPGVRLGIEGPIRQAGGLLDDVVGVGPTPGEVGDGSAPAAVYDDAPEARGMIEYAPGEEPFE